MSRFALTSALLLALTAPAFADGKAQLAGPLGVNPADYTLAQLIQLGNAVRDNDAAEIAFVKDQASGRIVSSQGTVSPGQAMQAAILGVNPADFTPAQLIRLETAVRENDTQEIAFVKAQAEGKIVSTQGTISPGLAMQAAILGVDPAKYTASQLAVMTGDADN